MRRPYFVSTMIAVDLFGSRRCEICELEIACTFVLVLRVGSFTYIVVMHFEQRPVPDSRVVMPTVEFRFVAHSCWYSLYVACLHL